LLKLNYNTIDGDSSVANKLYNGNIAETSWSSSPVVRAYGYKYDNLNRLLFATYQKLGTTPQHIQVTKMYNENLTYDKNGNIKTLNRNGDNDAQVGERPIDNLSYDYAANSNKLLGVIDYSNNTSGFKDDNKIGDDYSYDANGNLTRDKNKGIWEITYNHLNLPTKIDFFGRNGAPGNNIITYTYNANGQKVNKKVQQEDYSGSIGTYNTDYLGVFQYANKYSVNASSPPLSFISTSEGYVNNRIYGSETEPTFNFKYVYQYKDHLGNIRLSYGDFNNDGVVAYYEIQEESNYYPFGLKHNGYNNIYYSENAQPNYKYKFNGKELQDELQLNMYDYGARNYDPALGRWMNVDPLAEMSRRFSPYTYANNNPVYFIDPDGMLVSPSSGFDDWIKNKTSGQVEWRAEVTSAETTPSGFEYIGKVYNGISIKTYETTSTSTSAGLSIQVDYKGPETSADVDFMQTVRTNMPSEGATSPYNDPAPPKGKPAEDNKPFYYTDSEKPSYSDRFGQDLIFTDSPRRPTASGKGTNWSGELSITTKANGVHSIKETLNYGFKIENGKSVLSPVIIQPASDFQKTTLDNYNKTLKKE
jgi:RHS repeat-associated protein